MKWGASLKPTRLALVVLGCLLPGCVYYNGMYNANRLANSARNAEREGRTFEANNLWGQVATKAESVLVRHPQSKYAEEAAILRGVALARLGQCEAALSPLSRIGVAQLKSQLSEEAGLAAGRCYMTLGNVAAADAAFTEVLDSRNVTRRREARLQRARTLRASGRYEEALKMLQGERDRRVQPELLLSLAGAGRVPEAMVLADSLIARNDTTQPWDSLVVALGRQDPSSASALVDRLRQLPRRSPEIQARWLFEDGLRLLATDTARAVARFRDAVAIGGQSSVAGSATVQLVRLEVSRISQPQELTPARQKIKGIAARNPSAAPDLAQLDATLMRVLAASDSATPGTPQADLRLFLAAELARDSRQTPQLAEAVFLRIVNDWPDSPYAPKALLAAQQLDPSWADSARTLLETRYMLSPYLAIIRGEEGSAYRELEDSLAAFAAARTGQGQPERPGAPRRPGVPTSDDDDTPSRRRPAPGVRVAEP